MTALRIIFYLLTLSCVLIMFAIPCLCISVSYRADGAASSSNYHLDTSTTLNSVGRLGDGTISRASQVSGSGENEFSDQTSAKGSVAESTMISSGKLIATASTTASGEVADLSLDVAGSGDLTAAISGSSGSAAADQYAGTASGVLSTSQGVAAGSDKVVASQNTQINGDAAALESNAFSEKNHMAAQGGYSGGDGGLNAQMISTSSDRAIVDGQASVAGTQCLRGEDFREIANDKSDRASVFTNGIALDNNKNLLDFGSSIVNVNAMTDNKQGDGTSTGESVQSEAGSGSWPSKPIGPAVSSSRSVLGNIGIDRTAMPSASSTAHVVQVQRTRTNGQAATASFESIDPTGCIITDAAISASKGSVRQSDSLGSTKTTSQAVIVLLVVFDQCAGNLLLSAFGLSNDDDADIIDIDPLLRKAKAKSTVPMVDMISGVPFDVNVDMAWTATAPAVFTRYGSVQHTPGFTMASHFVGFSRPATAVGTITSDYPEPGVYNPPDGNWVSTPSFTGELDASKDMEISITR